MAGWTTTDLESVETAIRTMMTSGGAQRVSIGGKMVEFFDLQTLRDLRREMQRELYGSTNATTKASFRYFKA